jgi:L-2-hydroxyglutarate oxidase LhgO
MNSMLRFEAVIVGAGVVGLSIARALAVSGLRILLLEKEDRIGTGNSSRNSEVIHAGLHYPLGSLMSRLCIEGRDLMYKYCSDKGVPVRQVGKLLVATLEEQVEKLRAMEVRGKETEADAAGLRGLKEDNKWTPMMLNTRGLRLLSSREAKVMEPDVRCVAALWVPASGIVDSSALMSSLLNDIKEARGEVLLRSRVIEVDAIGSPIRMVVQTEDGGGKVEERKVLTDWLINSAGLEAHSFAASIQGMPAAAIPQMKFAKGNYFYVDRCPFNHLVYPIPEQGGLGTHFTRDLKGQGKFGPDVQWIEAGKDLDYSVDPNRQDAFYSEIRKYWPQLPDGALRPGYCGIRPKLVGHGEPDADFLIQTPSDHNLRGLINLFGIQSPGLTSSLAIGKLVKKRIVLN